MTTRIRPHAVVFALLLAASAAPAATHTVRNTANAGAMTDGLVSIKHGMSRDGLSLLDSLL